MVSLEERMVCLVRHQDVLPSATPDVSRNMTGPPHFHHPTDKLVAMTMPQLIEEVRRLLRRTKCPSRKEECSNCGRLGRQWPSLKLEFGSIEDLGPLSSMISATPAAPTTTVCTLTFQKHFHEKIAHQTTNLQILSFGYTETELWESVSPMIHRIQLSTIPTAMKHHGSHVEILELRAKGRHVMNSLNDNDSSASLDNSEEDDKDSGNDESLLPLFQPNELEVLLTILSPSSLSQSCLQTLHLERCAFENVSMHPFFDAIAQSSTLIDVKLKDCDLTSSVQRHAREETPSSSATASSGDTSVSSCLTDLSIEGCVLGEDALTCLCRLLLTSLKLQHVVLVQNDCPLRAGSALVESLMVHTFLETLDLSALDGGEDFIVAVGRLLVSSGGGGLKRLNLSENPQLIDVTPLASALRINSSLLELDLSLNRLWNMGILAEALSQNKTLQRLNLSKATLENEDDDSDEHESALQREEEGQKTVPLSFFSGLQKTHFHCLNLSYLSIPVDLMKDLASSLRFNTSLHTLQVNDLRRDFEPAQLHWLFHSLRDNSTLKSLEVGRNPLTEEDVMALASSLVINRSLASLTLSGCDLTDELLLPFASRLSNYGLSNLELSFNAITKEGADVMLQGLQSNRRMESIALYNSCWSVGGPTHFECDGFANEDRAMQSVVRNNRRSNWVFRLEHAKDSPTRLYHLLREEIPRELEF